MLACTLFQLADALDGRRDGNISFLLCARTLWHCPFLLAAIYSNVRTALSRIIASHTWKQKDLAREAGMTRSELAQHLSGARKVSWKHLHEYCVPLDSQERQMLLAAWLRDNASDELVQTWLPLSGDDLAPPILDWTPPLDGERKAKFEWLAREVQRDPELAQYILPLIDALGYGKKRATGKKRKRR
jgi:DNA-binding Xre family transcriptional regulator